MRKNKLDSIASSIAEKASVAALADKTMQETTKLKLEADILRMQFSEEYKLSEKLKAGANLATILVAFAALVGGLGSFIKWINDEGKTRQLHVEQRLDATLVRFSSSIENERLAAVSSLRSFLGENNETQDLQVLSAVSSDLALEKSPVVRRAIVSLISDLNTDSLTKPTLDKSLALLVQTSRGMVADRVLRESRPRFPQSFDSQLDGANLQAIADAIVLLLRKNAQSKDMHGIYLGKSDLDNINLVGTDFSDAILAWSTFNNANLSGSSFRDADLEQTKFVGADLRSTKFTSTYPLPQKVKIDYVLAQMNRSLDGQIQVSMPDFKCADLRNADFRGHPLFGMTENSVPGAVYFTWAVDFTSANLEGTDFSGIRVFSLVPQHTEINSQYPIFPFSSIGVVEAYQKKEEYTVGVYEFTTGEIPENNPLERNFGLFSKSFQMVALSLSSSNWKKAILPKFIHKWASENPVPYSDLVGPTSPSCNSRIAHDS